MSCFKAISAFSSTIWALMCYYWLPLPSPWRFFSPPSSSSSPSCRYWSSSTVLLMFSSWEATGCCYCYSGSSCCCSYDYCYYCVWLLTFISKSFCSLFTSVTIEWSCSLYALYGYCPVTSCGLLLSPCFVYSFPSAYCLFPSSFSFYYYCSD